jgi:hypothetical protein
MLGSFRAIKFGLAALSVGKTIAAWRMPTANGRIFMRQNCASDLLCQLDLGALIFFIRPISAHIAPGLRAR